MFPQYDKEMCTQYLYDAGDVAGMTSSHNVLLYNYEIEHTPDVWSSACLSASLRNSAGDATVVFN